MLKKNKNQKSETWFAALCASIIAIMPFSIDAYLPAMPTITASLHTEIHQVEVTLGLFLLGGGIAQLVGGPFSDRNGRRLTALIGLTIYIIGAIGLAFSDSIFQFKMARLIQAFGAGCATVVVSASVRDRFSGRKAAKIFALIGIIMMGAPLLAPIVGAALLNAFGWRSIFLFLASYASVVWLVVFMFFKRQNLKPYPKASQSIFAQAVSNYLTVLKTRPALGFLAIQAASFGSMIAFLSESSFVYIELYELSETEFSWFFACNIITCAFLNRVNAYKLKTTEPQKILFLGMCLQLFCNVTLFMLAWFGQPSLFLILPFIMFSVGSQSLIVNAIACFLDYFGKNAGTANAISGMFGLFIAALVGFITSQLHDGKSILPMVTMMVCCSLVGISFTFILSKDMRRFLIF